ncbi:hypothetical protein [Nostoc commune]|uniref:hypothetical protein n=1 Tax=Nostoc commune TaxID=1178 RepID=UPI002073A7E7|nr:hypothetical protein [Nostoc commune]
MEDLVSRRAQTAGRLIKAAIKVFAILYETDKSLREQVVVYLRKSQEQGAVSAI